MTTISRTLRIWDYLERRHVHVRVDIEIDADKLAGIVGLKAWNNKNKRTKFIRGAVAGEVRLSVREEAQS